MTEDLKDLIIKISDLTNQLILLEDQRSTVVSSKSKSSQNVKVAEYYNLKESLYGDLYKALQKCKAIRYDRISRTDDTSVMSLYINFFNERCPIFTEPLTLKIFENEDVVNHLLTNHDKISISNEFKKVLSIFTKYEKNPDSILDSYIEILKERDIDLTQSKIISTESIRDKYIQDLETLKSNHGYTKPIKNNVFNRLFHRQQLKYQDAQTGLKQSINESENALTGLNSKMSELQSPSSDLLDTYRTEAINIFTNVKSTNEFLVSLMEILDILTSFQKDNNIDISRLDQRSIDDIVSTKTLCRYKINSMKKRIYKYFESVNIEELITNLHSATKQDLPDKVYENIPKILELINEYNNLDSNDFENY